MGLINMIGNAQNSQNVTSAMRQGLNDYSDALKENTGEKGFLSAHQNALGNVGQLSSLAGNTAQSQAMDASRQMGTSKAQSALNAANTAANASAKTTVNTYNQNYAQNVANQRAKINAVLKKSALASEAAKTQYAASQAQLAQAQSALASAVKFYQTSGIGDAVKSKVDDIKNLYSDNFVSDICLKEALPEATSTDAMSQIESILYKYKPEAQEEYGVDNDEHIGVTAQSVEKVWPEAVITDENGIKQLDKQKLLESVTAGIASLSKEIEDIKNGI